MNIQSMGDDLNEAHSKATGKTRLCNAAASGQTAERSVCYEQSRKSENDDNPMRKEKQSV